MVFQTIFWNAIIFISKQNNYRKVTKLIADKKIRNKTVLHLSNNVFQNLKWIKPDKEFVFEENIYDVIRIDEKIASTTIICYNDINDNALLSLLEKDNDGNSKQKQILKKVFKTKFVSTKLINFTLFHNSSTVYNKHKIPYKSIYITIDSPPPIS